MAIQGRPKKVRIIQKMPKIVQFSPRGKPGRPDEVEITLDEFEAFKLADYQGFTQAQGASAMRVSRASFGRILRGARAKVADALVNGKTMKIRMGDVQVGVRRSELNEDTLKEEVARYEARNKKIAKQAAALSRSKQKGAAVKRRSKGHSGSQRKKPRQDQTV